MIVASAPTRRKYVARAANFVFLLAVRFKVLPSWGTDVESGGLGGAGSSPLGAGGAYAPVPGGQRAEAERRRCASLSFFLLRPSPRTATRRRGINTHLPAARPSAALGGVSEPLFPRRKEAHESKRKERSKKLETRPGTNPILIPPPPFFSLFLHAPDRQLALEALDRRMAAPPPNNTPATAASTSTSPTATATAAAVDLGIKDGAATAAAGGSVGGTGDKAI